MPSSTSTASGSTARGRTLAKRKKPKSITIIGRRWFARTYGNTYHSAEILVDGVPVGKIQAYGYGDQYVYNAMSWLAKNEYIKGYGDDQHSIPWRWAEDNKVVLTYTVSDVARQKDL